MDGDASINKARAPGNLTFLRSLEPHRMKTKASAWGSFRGEIQKLIRTGSYGDDDMVSHCSSCSY